MSAIGKGRKNGYLTARVISFNICFGISLRITVLLRFLQRLIEIQSVHCHLCQNIIGGSIQDSINLVNLIRGKRGV